MNVRINEEWKSLLKDEFEKPYFHELITFVKNEYAQHPGRIFPAGNEIFRAFDLCPPSKVKVVILGQDPYPTKGHAHGLCFSVDEKVKPLPKSLVNIFKELESDLSIQAPSNGDLSNWAQQGVLLINTVLTVREGLPDSHSGKGWEKFTDAAIQHLANSRSELVYVLWGAKAQKKVEYIDTQKNLIISSPHPSPLSAHRGFFGSKPFSRINEYLLKKGQTQINW
ncbi:MAG: uracil-DNA glycosylase [Bacteroidetes bacterium]|nr:MAG: uracil-DNA glycosylase [Bacteroidota bacterium]